MHAPRILCLCFLLASVAATALASSPVNSTISAVTVYPDRAVVTRTLTYQVDQPGLLEISLDRLPATLVDQSLQVSGSGTAQATLLDVTPRVIQVDSTPNERVKDLEDRIRDVQKQEDQLDDRSKVLQEQNASLDNIERASTQAPTKDAPRLALDDASKLLAFLEEQRGKVTAEVRSIADQKEELGKRRGTLERQLAELRGAGVRSYKSVTLRFTATTAGALDLTISYAVPGALWEPSYDARVTDAGHSVSLGYFGIVRQFTGEDWTNVDLTLSTARPSIGGAPPPLVGWTLDVVQPRRPGLEAEDAIALEKFAVEAREQAPAAAPGEISGGAFDEAGKQTRARVASKFLQSVIQNKVTSASFKIPVPSTVPSDNSPQKVPIATISLSAEAEYLAIPKHLPAAFLSAKVNNTSDFPLIGGSMSVFLDGTFVASSALESVMPGERFDLALGADGGIAVKRKLNSKFTEDTGLVTKKKRTTYDFTLTVQNNKKAAVKVRVLDQVPVSRNEAIVVTVDEPAEGDAKREADGTVKWELTLQPAEKRELPLKFSVEYPSDARVTGLE
jgi:uncharacterized protein (TIGR02231 family)